jgi:hypothetical protein
MTASTARRVGGFGALALGVVFFIVFPTLGLVEALAGVLVLAAHRPTDRTVSLAAIVPTILILPFAILNMLTNSTIDQRMTVALAVGSALTTLVLLRTALATKSPRLQLP